MDFSLQKLDVDGPIKSCCKQQGQRESTDKTSNKNSNKSMGKRQQTLSSRCPPNG